MRFLDQFNWAFFKLLSFRLMIVLAYQIMSIVVGWHIYELTHDPLSLGLVGLAEVIPNFCFALFAGYAVDHYSRRLFGILAGLLLGFSGFTLVAVTEHWVVGDPVLWIYAAIAATGTARAFTVPSYGALFALVLPRDQYARASGVGSSVFQFGRVVGPAIGGILVGWSGKTVAYSLAASLCLIAVLALLLLRIKEPPAAESTPIFKGIIDGLRFVFNHQIILGAQSLDMFAVLFGGAVAMLPAFVEDIFHYGPEGLGILRTAPAVGAIMTGLVLARHPLNRHAGRWLLATVAGFGLSMIGFGLSINFWVAVAFLLLSGGFDGVSVVLRSTILQLTTPDQMRGRVSAINGLFIGSSNELGAFESGIAARLMGLVPSVVFGGGMTLLVVATTSALAPKLRRLELQQLE